jgi:hypothetical protein
LKDISNACQIDKGRHLNIILDMKKIQKAYEKKYPNIPVKKNENESSDSSKSMISSLKT